MRTLTTSPSEVNGYIQQLKAAGIESVEVIEFEAGDVALGTYMMCQIKWTPNIIVTAGIVPADCQCTVIEEHAKLPADLFGWTFFTNGQERFALQAIGVRNAIRAGEKFLPEVGDVFWVVSLPGIIGYMPTERTAAAKEVASWPCQKWQRVA